MQAQKEVLAKIVSITLLIKSFPLLLPSHNCINNSQCSVFKVHLWISKRLNEVSCFQGTSVNLFFEVVGQNGLEPSTSRLSVVCSSQLSYWPISASLLLVEISGIEPLTSCLQGRRSPSWAKPPYLSPVLKFHSIIVNCQLSIVNYSYVCTL